MDHAVLKKRLNTFKTAKGTLSQISDDVVVDVLRAWENWPKTTAELNRELGLSRMQMVTIIQKAKKLVKMGVVPDSEFKEVKIAGSVDGITPCGPIELAWDKGKVIRFAEVELLVDFLKKVA